MNIPCASTKDAANNKQLVFVAKLLFNNIYSGSYLIKIKASKTRSQQYIIHVK